MTAVTGEPEIPKVDALVLPPALEALAILDALDMLETAEVVDALEKLEEIEVLDALDMAEVDTLDALGISATLPFWVVVAALSPDEHPASDDAITLTAKAATNLPLCSAIINRLPNIRSWIPSIVASWSSSLRVERRAL